MRHAERILSREVLGVESAVLSSITINSNIASLNAQRRLGRSTASLQDSFTRLSSGLRINKAADDAAGLSIAESLNTDQRVLNQGVRNLNDGVSLLAIADGALSELSSITTRLAELAEQASNGALSKQQRSALNEEAQALRDEFSRITDTTEFNGVKLFDRSYGELKLQSGFGENGGIVSGLGGAIGTAELEAAEHFSTTANASNPVAKDFNGDGIVDVAVTVTGGDVNVLMGQSDGTFGSAASYDIGSTGRSLQAGDFNADGFIDLVASRGGPNSYSVLLGNGDGSFVNAGTDALPATGDEATVGDFNGDGFDDLAFNHSGNTLISVAIGKGDGTFGSIATYYSPDYPVDIVTADFTGDGVLDLVTVHGTDDSVVMYVGNGDGTFKSSIGAGGGDNPQHIETADLNNDGAEDLVIQYTTSSNFGIRLGDGAGGFTFAGTTTSLSSVPFEFTLADINGDSFVDIISDLNAGNTINVQLGKGDGTFEDGVDYDSGHIAAGIAVGDLNRDGVLDVITAGANSPGGVGVMLSETTEGVSPLLEFSLLTQAGARQALPQFNNKLDQLASQRGQIGAFEARLNTAIATTRVTSENYATARSQINDADVAVEAANLVRNQILQQAGAAILAQSNQSPALALALLG